ncbi:MAG: transcription termination/antitermination protein NusG, partial [Clostridia bacterium]|nr:transcription termination/antitermination protein NusG [Clostridia bacterium]
PVPLSDFEVDQMGIESKIVTLSFAVGDRVKLTSTDFEGVVASISDDKKKARVMVSMFGRETPIDVDVKDVEKIIY